MKKAFVWTFPETGAEYIVFARTEQAARDFLGTQYRPDQLERLLFDRPCRVRPMPEGVVTTSPRNNVWLPKE